MIMDDLSVLKNCLTILHFLTIWYHHNLNFTNYVKQPCSKEAISNV